MTDSIINNNSIHHHVAGLQNNAIYLVACSPHTSVLKAQTLRKKHQQSLNHQDHGWAWMVLLSSFVIRFLCFGTLLSLDVYYTELQHRYMNSRPLAALIVILQWIIFDISAPIGSLLVYKVGARISIIIGGLLLGFGFLVSSFATTVEQLIPGTAVVVGVGCQFASTGNIKASRTYFARYRDLSQGLSSLGPGLGMLVMRQLIRLSLEENGWKATLVYHGAALLHLCVAGSIVFSVTNIKEVPKCETKTTCCCSKPRCSSIWTNPRFYVLLFSYFFFRMGFFSNIGILDGYAENYGLGEVLVPSLIVFAIGDMIGRPMNAAASTFPISPVFFFAIILLFQTLLQIGLVTTSVDWQFYLYMFLYGAQSGCANGLYFTLPGLLFKGDVSFVAFSVLSPLAGIGILIGTLVAGQLADETGNYGYSYLVLGGSSFFGVISCLIFWWFGARNTKLYVYDSSRNSNSLH